MRYTIALVFLMVIGFIALINQPAPSQAQQQFPTFTPTRRPLPTATREGPGCGTRLPLDYGGLITLRPGVNIRTEPSASAPLLANFQENKIFTLLDGPVCRDDFEWWQITGHGITGWVAERNIGQWFFRDYQPDPNKPPDCRTPLVLGLNEEIELVLNVRIREEAGLQGRVLTIAPVDTVVTIINTEPICADGYNWWQIRATVVNVEYEGWMVEGRSSTDDTEPAFVELTPAPDCAAPMPASVGDEGRVRYNDQLPKALRAEPARDGELLYTLVEGVPFEIIGGPVCSEGMNYWQVRILANTSVSGWLAEGARPNYWIHITNDIGRFDPPTITPTPTIRGAVTLTPFITLTPVPTVTP